MIVIFLFPTGGSAIIQCKVLFLFLWSFPVRKRWVWVVEAFFFSRVFAIDRDAANSAPKVARSEKSVIPSDRKRYQLPPGARGLAQRANVRGLV